jgi:hypothetical protein
MGFFKAFGIACGLVLGGFAAIITISIIIALLAS